LLREEHNVEADNYDDVGMEVDDRLYSNEEGVSEMTELLLVVPRKKPAIESSINNCNDEPRSLHAGGGHSALLTNGGDLYLWGWNDSGQLGRSDSTMTSNTSSEQDSMKCDKDGTVADSQSSCPLSNVVVPPLSFKVESVALGHSHTLVIEKDTGRLFGFGDDGRGQVSGLRGDSKVSSSWYIPRLIKFDLLEEESDGFVAVATGLFHSAAITRRFGELITWGCGRFVQCLRSTSAVTDEDGASTMGRWKPPDGSKLVQVACGRQHTALLDEHGRVWTMGNNKYGQLGRLSSTLSYHEPKLVDGPLGQIDSGCFSIHTGWSHIIALTRDDEGTISVYGWGRNDKGQLGMNSVNDHIFVPQAIDLLINDDIVVQAACCGAESSHIRDTNGNIYSTGWNEHGNLAIGNVGEVIDTEYSTTWMVTTGASMVASPFNASTKDSLIAAGGAHLIAT
jgi:alpha-tubulin suppressor-like RCC1 family protein